MDAVAEHIPDRIVGCADHMVVGVETILGRRAGARRQVLLPAVAEPVVGR